MRREITVASILLAIATFMMLMIFFGDPDSDALTDIIHSREQAGGLRAPVDGTSHGL